MDRMRTTLAIGDFSQATHLSIKTLRHYHRVGLLEPADVDPGTGHRRYTADQIATAQVIRRFRSLDMPLEDIQQVISAPDVLTRNALISGHLRRLEATLARTQEAAASLRDLLQPPAACAPVVIEHRQVAATPAVAVRDVLDLEDAASWFQGALGELHAIAAAQKLTLSGPAGGSTPAGCLPTNGARPPSTCPAPTRSGPPGGLPRSTVPAVEVALITHLGSHQDVDRSYGALGAYVAEHALGIDGPVREFYAVGPQDTRDEALWRTEIGWPVFQTAAGASPAS